jgi:MOSC domain-containing protein YiiM
VTRTETSPEDFEHAWQALPPLPRQRGSVDLLVCRLGGGRHSTPQRVGVSAEAGVAGDRWSRDERDPSVQVTLMMTRVAELIAQQQALPLHLAGDNLLVGLDLHERALPVGTRLRAGTAVLEVTAEPHLGCKKFRERFGSGALRWVNDKAHRDRRLRGVNCRVVVDGEIALGDALEVLSPPHPTLED